MTHHGSGESSVRGFINFIERIRRMNDTIFDFPSILEEARLLFEERIKLPVTLKDRINHCTQNGIPPRFTLGIKNNKIVCRWVGNFRKDRSGRPKKDGTCTVFSVADITSPSRYSADDIAIGFTPTKWDKIGLELIRLKERLNAT